MKTKFSRQLWRWTGPQENLFELDAGEIAIFSALVGEATQ